MQWWKCSDIKMVKTMKKHDGAVRKCWNMKDDGDALIKKKTWKIEEF